MLEVGQRVRVHFNLHRGDFSVIDPKTGKVVANVPGIVLSDAEFRVSEKSRQRAIDRGRRSVHAYVIGFVSALSYRHNPGDIKVTYNPFRSGFFHQSVSGDRVDSADSVGFSDGYCWI